MIKNITVTFISKVLIGVLNLLVVIFLSRHLGASGKGEASLILTSITLFLIACNVVGGATLVYLVPRFSTLTLVFISYLWTIASSCAVFLCVHFTALLPPEFEIHILFLSMIDSFFSSNNNLLLGLQKIRLVNILSFIKAFTIAAILFLFLSVFKSQNVSAYITTLYYGFSLSFLLSFIMILVHKIQIQTKKNIQEIIVYCLKLGGINQLGHIVQFVNLRLSYYLLSRFSGDNQLGVYSNGVSLVESVWLISNSIATVQYAKIANTIDNEQSVALTLKLTRISLLICLIAVSVMALLPASFYVALFGPEFVSVKEVIYTLIPGVVFYNIALIAGHYFSGIGKYEVEVWGNCAGLIITLSISVIAVFKNYSSFWAGIISSVSYLTTTAVIVIYFYKHNNVKPSEFFPRLRDFKTTL